MRKLQFLALLFLIVFTAACGQQSGREAEHVAVAYVKALFSRDTNQVMSMVYLPEQINVLVSDKMIKDLLQTVLDQLPDDVNKNLKVEALKSTVEDNKAAVRVKISAAGHSSEETIHLVNIDGWKVVPNF